MNLIALLLTIAIAWPFVCVAIVLFTTPRIAARVRLGLEPRRQSFTLWYRLLSRTA